MRRIISGAMATLALLSAGLGLAADKAKPAGTRSGVDKSYVVADIRPQDDLFRHVNGKWLKEATIPADRSLDGAFHKLRDKSESDLRAIIEEAARSEKDSGPESKKVGDLYKSFMDEATVDRLGLEPIMFDLKLIDSALHKSGFILAMARLQKDGVEGLIGLHVDTDAKKSDRYIVYLSQAGIGLPDESYYRDAKFTKIREAYVAHIEKTLEQAGVSEAGARAKSIMAIETRLAKGHWDRVKSRDDTLTYNKLDRAELAKLAHGFDWALWFETMGAKGVEEVVVRQPSYFTAMAKAFDEVPLDDWKAWLKWQVLHDASPMLGKAFVDEDFNFYGKTLTGAQELRPRWKRGVAAVERSLGEAVGKLYVAKHFPPAAKERMQVLVKNLIEAYRRDILELDWMSPVTKKRALEKLAKFNPKIGYTDKWRDYSALRIKPDDLVGNIHRASGFELDRNLAKLGKPVDKGEWMMTPQTVNAYYNSGMNEIVFPAAILQPPFFDLEADDAVNYGGIGAVIGHEIGHGFDDQGSKFDGDGNMNDWWTDLDRKEFDKRSKMLIEQYDTFEPAQLPGQHVNGALTIGENIGDLGGLTIAYKAYKISLAGKESPTLDGLTGPQRFFFGWAQVWRTKARDAELQRRLAVDPHSPGEFRCNGVVRNLSEFYEAFGVKEGDKLYLPPDRRVRIW
jgi:putative endopeptidase